MRVQLPVVGGAYQSNVPEISALEAVNCYAELGADASNRTSLVGSHGYEEVVDLGAPIRALRNAWGRLYAVAGGALHHITGPTSEVLGYVGEDSNPASLSNNIFELLVVSSGAGWVAQKAGHTFSYVSDSDFPVSVKADFLDGYGMLLEKDSGRFHFTTINDFEAISGIDFATAEGQPDDLVSMLVDHRELWLFGDNTIEVWDNVGAANNPFQRRAGAFIERGCRGAFSPAKVDNTAFWLGENNIVYRADGLTPIRVSNHGIENLIGKTSTEPIGLAYTWEGHEFYQLSFPGELTVAYDASTQLWHTRKKQGYPDLRLEHHARIGARHYMGGQDGKIYQLKGDSYQIGTADLPRSRAIGPLRVADYGSMSELTCVFETGSTDDMVNPSEVFLEISDDAGRTFGSRITASLGKQADHPEVKFRALGGFYDNQRVLKITMTDNAPFNLVDAWAEVHSAWPKNLPRQ